VDHFSQQCIGIWSGGILCFMDRVPVGPSSNFLSGEMGNKKFYSRNS